MNEEDTPFYFESFVEDAPLILDRIQRLSEVKNRKPAVYKEINQVVRNGQGALECLVVLLLTSSFPMPSWRNIKNSLIYWIPILMPLLNPCLSMSSSAWPVLHPKICRFSTMFCSFCGLSSKFAVPRQWSIT